MVRRAHHKLARTRCGIFFCAKFLRAATVIFHTRGLRKDTRLICKTVLEIWCRGWRQSEKRRVLRLGLGIFRRRSEKAILKITKKRLIILNCIKRWKSRGKSWTSQTSWWMKASFGKSRGPMNEKRA